MVKMNFDKIIAVRNNKTIFRDNDKCIKLFGKDYPKDDILNEALNQARIERTDINVPKILSVESFDGKWAIVSEYIKGKTVAQLMQENPDKKDEYLNRIVDIQIDIQSKKSPLLNRQRDKFARKIMACDLDATTRYDLLTRLESMPKHEKICHGDFNPSNVIIDENNKAYIIDWSHVTQGNASADVARTYLLFWLHGDINGAKKYLDLFCQKTGTDKKYVQKWMPIVAASQLVKGNEKEREFLHSWINVVEYE